MINSIKSITSAIFILTPFIFLFIVSGAQAALEYTIKKGDNPSNIARKYKVSVEDLLKENKIAPKNMKPGARIIIPRNKKETAKNRKKGTDKKESAVADKQRRPGKYNVAALEEIKQASDNLHHTVKKGDTLSSLSKKYSIPSGELRELNNLRSSKLKKGQRLLVRVAGPKTYTVKKGDNIWKIARKFDMDPHELMAINEMESSSIKTGRKIYLQQKVQPTTAEAYNDLVAKNVEEELKEVAESDDFLEKRPPDKLVAFARKLIDIPYKFGGNSILGIDCSGYVKKVYGLLGIELPRSAREQFKTGEAIEKDELSMGDLVFFKTYASFPSHVGIYLGNNLFIHASSRGKKVTIDSLDTPYYLKRFIGAKRLLTEVTELKQEKDTEG